MEPRVCALCRHEGTGSDNSISMPFGVAVISAIFATIRYIAMIKIFLDDLYSRQAKVPQKNIFHACFYKSIHFLQVLQASD